jgi:hypothetical protein
VDPMLVALMPFVVAIVALGCITSVIVTWLNSRRKSAAVSDPQVAVRLAGISEQLNRMDGALDAVAVEVERISEAQRFTARVLSERSAAALPESPPRA